MVNKRIEIIKKYKKNLLKFLVFNIYLVISALFFDLIIKDNRFNIDFWTLLLCVIVFIILLGISLKKSFSNNNLLMYSGLFMFMYFLSFVELLFVFAELFLIFSVLYEIFMRFIIGVEIEPKFKYLSWNSIKKYKK